MDQPTPTPGTYQAVGAPPSVPAVEAKNPGFTQGIVGIVCAVISLLLLPPVFGTAGIILGILSLRHGEKKLGMIVIVLSAVCMIAGFAFGVYVHLHPELFQMSHTSAAGAVIEAFSN